MDQSPCEETTSQLYFVFFSERLYFGFPNRAKIGFAKNSFKLYLVCSSCCVFSINFPAPSDNKISISFIKKNPITSSI